MTSLRRTVHGAEDAGEEPGDATTRPPRGTERGPHTNPRGGTPRGRVRAPSARGPKARGAQRARIPTQARALTQRVSLTGKGARGVGGATPARPYPAPLRALALPIATVVRQRLRFEQRIRVTLFRHRKLPEARKASPVSYVTRLDSAEIAHIEILETEPIRHSVTPSCGAPISVAL